MVVLFLAYYSDEYHVSLFFPPHPKIVNFPGSTIKINIDRLYINNGLLLVNEISPASYDVKIAFSVIQTQSPKI